MSGAVPSRRAARTADRPRTTARRDARRSARTSAATDRGRFPLAVLIAVPALAGLLLLALGVGGLLGLPGGPVLTALAALLLAALVLAGLRLLNAPGPGLVGAPLTERQEPEVWTAIVDAAARVRVPTPRHLVVDGSALIRVAPSAEGHDLAVGLPLLLQLDPDDLRAVLARELAQHSDAGPRAATRVRRLGERLDAVLAGDRARPTGWLLARYRQLHASLAADAVRQARRAADELAETAARPVALARATERLTGVQLAWQVLVEEYLPAAAQAGVRPRLAEGLRELLAHRGPDLLARARLPGNPDPLDRLQPVPGVLDGATAGRIEAAILRDDRPAESWQQVSEALGAAQTERDAAGLAGVVPTGGAEPTLAAVLAGLARDDRPDPPGGLGAGLTALARHALICQGLARCTTGWAGPATVQRRDPRGGWIAWDGGPLVQAAVEDPAAVEQLASWLIAAGADLDRPLRRYVPEATSAAGPMQVTGLPEEDRADLLVFADGVLLAPVRGAGTGAQRLAGVVRSVGDAPRRPRAGRWIGVGDVRDAAVRERRYGLELQLRFADGSAIVAAATPGTALRGEPLGDLRRLLAHDEAG